MIYLFLGQDSLSKDSAFKKIRKELLPKETEHFNLDIFHARDVSLKEFQERVSALPVQNKKRLIIIKGAQHLKKEIKEFILKNAKKEIFDKLVLVLDVDQRFDKDDPLNRILRYAEVFRFKETIPPNTFTLIREIDNGNAQRSLQLLHQILLEEAERPERIIGGLRYAWERAQENPLKTKKRLKFLLNCDIDIKTGKLKPLFALEKLILKLCALRNFSY
ncbi:MAG: hypothetical protein PHI86_06580 [Candidatus Omnitrophica bacterium]|nr:hypothetical protein [Candidatus Omnitrophota bacterium]